MKNKLLFLIAVISSCGITASAADPLNPNQPDPALGNRRACYDGRKCTGSPNAINQWGQAGGVCGNTGYTGVDNTYQNAPYGYTSESETGNKILRAESTEKFTGIVKSVNRVALPDQTQIQLVLETDKGDILVIVGPSNFVDQAKVKMQAGDKVTVTGYRVKANGNDVILAAEISGKNGNAVKLLDENRQPVWAEKPNGANGQYSYSSRSNTQTRPNSNIPNVRPNTTYQNNGGQYPQRANNTQAPVYSGSQHPYMPNSRQ